MRKTNRSPFKLLIVGVWLTFSVSLAAWWVVFGLRQVQLIEGLESYQASELGRHQKMLMWEGGVLILLLVGGGLALAYFVYQENKRYRQVSEFFATFSHEIKTSIASMRLQAESLQEDFLTDKSNAVEPHHRNLLDRLMKDSVRLELQLENSLFLSNVESQQLFEEKLPLSRVIEAIQPQWPGLKLNLEKDCAVRADRRAVESVLKNLVQNSVVHGKAKNITLRPRVDGSRVKIDVEDDGLGFTGNIKNLAKLFVRHGSSSGSGVGLYLSRQLMNKMGGDLKFSKTSRGFSTALYFKEGSV